MKYSILFKNEYELNKNMPDFFININADQVVNNILRDDNGNLPVFYTPLKKEEDIKYEISKCCKRCQTNLLCNYN